MIMSQKIKSILTSLRIAEMPLSLSGVIAGAMFAAADYRVAFMVVVSALLASVSLHCFIASDTKVSVAASVILAVSAVYFSFGKILMLESLLLLLFTYFIMRLARGIVGTGRSRIVDGIMICFLTGPVAVFGTYYLCSHSFGTVLLLLPALSVGLLNVSAYGSQDGYGKGVVNALILSGMVLMTVYALLRLYDPWHYLFLLSLPMFIVYMAEQRKGRERYVLLVLSVSAFAVLSGLGFLVFLF